MKINVRILVGLRWWSDIKDDGEEVWRFDSYDFEFRANPVDKSFFWMSQVSYTGFWAVMFVLNALTFSIYWV
jgi:hypothetical protein